MAVLKNSYIFAAVMKHMATWSSPDYLAGLKEEDDGLDEQGRDNLATINLKQRNRHKRNAISPSLF